MKIGIDASRAAKDQRTGTEAYSYYLIKNLLKLDQTHEYILYAQKKLPDQIQKMYGERVVERIIPHSAFWSQLRLSREATKDNVDVLFIPSHVVPRMYTGTSLVTIHGLEYEQFPSGYTFLQKTYLRWTTKYGVRKAAKIIVPSTETKKLLNQYYAVNKSKVVVIPHGSNAQEIEQSTQISCKNKGEKYFLFIGSLVSRKNLATLLKAFVHFKDTGGSERLIIAGNASEHFNELFERLIPEGVGEDIQVAGYVSDEEYVCLLKNAQALVLPSHAEGFGMPALDAVQYGIPVIGSNHGFCADFYEDSPLLLQDEYSADELLQKMKFVTRSEKKQLVAREKAVAYTWEKSAQSVLRLLEQL